MDLVVVTDVAQRLVDIRGGVLLVRKEIEDKSHPHGPQSRTLRKESMEIRLTEVKLNKLFPYRPTLPISRLGTALNTGPQ